MKLANITQFDRFAILVMSVMITGPNISYADKEPFTYGTGNLMVVVERDNKSILVIDGTDLEVIKRISLPKTTQPHAPVFSPDGRYYYVMGRNGYYAKVDLLAQEIVAEQTIGTDSRGSAISMNGKYIFAGNYSPGSAVIMDARDLGILKRIEGPEALVGGKTRASRCASITDIGGVKDLMAVAWKDAGQVWIVDMKTAPEFKIIKKFRDAGGDIHDASVSDGGRYYMLADHKGNHLWILDAYKDIANDSTAYKGTIGTDPVPHASVCWGEVCFETNRGKGTVTAFNPATMEHIANIPTSRKYNSSSPGGLFTSKHPGAPHILSDSLIADKKTHRYIYV
ncbi:MAG: cytochrome D1 domain-containing protein, partial [Gammaproteobacteria bacterium]|nr:cytochrome D1 domain-containing protein [Gammaproteobacteria bacterium]